ncbi:transcriptional regulator, XRE family [Mycobacterium avium MAV_120709_2344]|nr:transcriptional regulator, XRE family [Mycobacterium avium MAV_120709_2344]
MKRQVDYTWRLAELMAARGMHNSTDLIPLLVERGSNCHDHRCIAWFINAPNGFRFK